MALAGRKMLLLAADDFEDAKLVHPRHRLREVAAIRDDTVNVGADWV